MAFSTVAFLTVRLSALTGIFLAGLGAFMVNVFLVSLPLFLVLGEAATDYRLLSGFLGALGKVFLLKCFNGHLGKCMIS